MGGKMKLQEGLEVPRIRMPEVVASEKTEDPLAAQDGKPILEVQDLNVYYGSAQALKSIHVEMQGKKATAFIGPSGCGKTTLLRCLNRMNDLIPNVSIKGSVKLDGQELYAPGTDVINLRRRVGMIFQKWNPFPK